MNIQAIDTWLEEQLTSLEPGVEIDDAKHAIKVKILQVYRNGRIRENMVALKAFGCFVSVVDGFLFHCPMNLDGSADLDDDGEGWADVSAPENQEFLDVVNVHFNTAFRLNQFSG